jgi:hypothetical protein
VLYYNWLRHNARFLERKIVAPATTSFLQAFVWGALIAFFPLYAIQCGIMNPGHFFSAIAIMMIAGRMLGGRIVDTYNKEKIILTFICTGMLTMIILSFSKTLPMFVTGDGRYFASSKINVSDWDCEGSPC